MHTRVRTCTSAQHQENIGTYRYSAKCIQAQVPRIAQHTGWRGEWTGVLATRKTMFV